MPRNLSQFAGLIPDTIDLSAYLVPDQSVSVRSASYFAERTIDVLTGCNQTQGQTLPWQKTHDKFQIRGGELSIWTGYKGHGKSMLISHCRRAFKTDPLTVGMCTQI